MGRAPYDICVPGAEEARLRKKDESAPSPCCSRAELQNSPAANGDFRCGWYDTYINQLSDARVHTTRTQANAGRGRSRREGVWRSSGWLAGPRASI